MKLILASLASLALFAAVTVGTSMDSQLDASATAIDQHFKSIESELDKIIVALNIRVLERRGKVNPLQAQRLVIMALYPPIVPCGHDWRDISSRRVSA